MMEKKINQIVSSINLVLYISWRNSGSIFLLINNKTRYKSNIFSKKETLEISDYIELLFMKFQNKNKENSVRMQLKNIFYLFCFCSFNVLLALKFALIKNNCPVLNQSEVCLPGYKNAQQILNINIKLQSFYSS